MTEAGLICGTPVNNNMVNHRTCGKLLPGVEAKVNMVIRKQHAGVGTMLSP